ncbi:MAG: hypothetical protein ACP5NC_08365 [Nitrososphaeria archaeon]
MSKKIIKIREPERNSQVRLRRRQQVRRRTAVVRPRQTPQLERLTRDELLFLMKQKKIEKKMKQKRCTDVQQNVADVQYLSGDDNGI